MALATETASDIPTSLPAPPSKRMRTDDVSFTVCFEQIASLKQLIEVVGSVLGRVFFQLVKYTPTSSDDDVASKVILSIDTIDPQHVCLVQSRLVCNGKINDEDASFCVDTATLLKCLKNLPSHHSVSISAKKGSADVELRSFDQMNENSDDFTFDLPTFEDDCEKIALDDLDYEFETNIELPELKRIIKLGDGLKCPVIKMGLHSYDSADGNTYSMTQFSAKGDATFKRDFPSIVCKNKDSDSSTNPIPDRSKMKLKFEASFSLDYFNRFVKAMEHQQVNLKFGKGTDDSDLPLVIKYPLGIPDSYVLFALAPKTDDSD